MFLVVKLDYANVLAVAVEVGLFLEIHGYRVYTHVRPSLN